MRHHRIAVLPGDGIGKEIMPPALQVLNTAASTMGTFDLQVQAFPWGCEHYLETGVVMPPDGVDILGRFDAIYFVAAGHPRVPDTLSAWEMIMVIRRRFRQYINLRPIKSWPGVPTLLADQRQAFDLLIVRENSEGEYAGPGGTVHQGQANEIAIQSSVFTRTGVERVARYAFDQARTRRGRVTNVTKSNAMMHSLVFWDKVVEEVRAFYPEIEYERVYVDAATMRFVQAPETLDVVLATNMFGDILSDLGGAVAGSIGLCPSANLNPEGEFPSMFEPIHGSAPDIAGRGIANPVGTVLSGALMLRQLGELAAADRVEQAVGALLARGPRTPDLGGTATTREVGQALSELVASTFPAQQES